MSNTYPRVNSCHVTYTASSCHLHGNLPERHIMLKAPVCVQLIGRSAAATWLSGLIKALQPQRRRHVLPFLSSSFFFYPVKTSCSCWRTLDTINIDSFAVATAATVCCQYILHNIHLYMRACWVNASFMNKLLVLLLEGISFSFFLV